MSLQTNKAAVARVCEICGQPLGFFRWRHPKCEERRRTVISEIETILTGFVGLADDSIADAAALKFAIDKRATSVALDSDLYCRTILDGFAAAVRNALLDRDLSDLELKRIQQISDQFEIEAAGIQVSGVNDLLTQALTLKDLRSGVVRSRCQPDVALPIVFKPGEVILWIFAGASRLEPKSSVQYLGGSHGFSIKIISGLWYRVGSSRGQRVETENIVARGFGDLVITSQNLHFLSADGNARLPIGSIATVDALSDAICVTPNRGKRQYFQNLDILLAADFILAMGALA